MTVRGAGRTERLRRVQLARASAVVVSLVLVPLSGCSWGDGQPAGPRPPRAPSVAGVELRPLPLPAVRTCRSVQKQARVPILCPTRLPRPVRGSDPSSALPVEPLAVAPWPGADGTAIGVDFSYSAETRRPRLDRPERFLHVQVIRQEEDLPPGARPARVGGKSGLFAPASSRDYAAESYFANHARFFWRERGVKYAATLHTFGAGTRRLLGSLVASLRPADRLRSPRRDSARRALRTIAVPVRGPVSVAAGQGGVWVAGQGDRFVDEASLVRIDADSERVAGARIRISRSRGAVAVAVAGSVWVAQRGVRRRHALRRLDPETARFVGSIQARPGFMALAVGAESLWAVDFGGGRGGGDGAVVRVPLETNHIEARTAVGRAPAGVAVGTGAVWVTNNLDGTVSRIDPRSNRVVETIRVGAGPVGVAVGEGGVWVANNGDSTVSHIDPRTDEVLETIRVGRGPRAVAVGEGSVWVTNEHDDTVSMIDPRSNRLAETIRVGAGPVGVAVGEGAVWVANNHDRTVTRIEPDAVQ